MISSKFIIMSVFKKQKKVGLALDRASRLSMDERGNGRCGVRRRRPLHHTLRVHSRKYARRSDQGSNHYYLFDPLQRDKIVDILFRGKVSKPTNLLIILS